MDLQRNINFTIKKAAKMVNKHRHLYLVSGTMREKLNFLLALRKTIHTGVMDVYLKSNEFFGERDPHPSLPKMQ